MHLGDYERMPSVGAAMTPFPYSVGPDASVRDVENLMATHRIRHVPIQQDGRVLGVVSDRELHHLVHAALPESDKARLRIRTLLRQEPYAVEMTTPLDEVASEMSRRHLGSAVVLRHGKLAGIFSTVDACRLLAEFLRDRFPEGPEAA
jgi:acetoin utilization protein AcuB